MTKSSNQKSKSPSYADRVAILSSIVGFVIALASIFLTIPGFIETINSSNPVQPTATAVSTTTFRYPVRVRDNTNQDVIPKALITIQVSDKAPFSQFTDNNGLALFLLYDNWVGNNATIVVSAAGYKVFILNTTISNSLPDVIMLDPEG